MSELRIGMKFRNYDGRLLQITQIPDDSFQWAGNSSVKAKWIENYRLNKAIARDESGELHLCCFAELDFKPLIVYA